MRIRRALYPAFRRYDRACARCKGEKTAAKIHNRPFSAFELFIPFGGVAFQRCLYTLHWNFPHWLGRQKRHRQHRLAPCTYRHDDDRRNRFTLAYLAGVALSGYHLRVPGPWPYGSGRTSTRDKHWRYVVLVAVSRLAITSPNTTRATTTIRGLIPTTATRIKLAEEVGGRHCATLRLGGDPRFMAVGDPKASSSFASDYHGLGRERLLKRGSSNFFHGTTL